MFKAQKRAITALVLYLNLLSAVQVSATDSARVKCLIEGTQQALHLERAAEPILSAEDIKTHLFAVHATDHLPMDGVLRAGAMDVRGHRDLSFLLRNTLHFSLGELVRPHSGFSWEGSRFAIVSPVGKVIPNLVNLHPYDTIAYGDLKIPAGSVILAPKGVSVPEFPGVGVVHYEGPVRDAVDRVIASRGGWKVTMNGGSGRAMFGTIDLSDPKAYVNLFKEAPQLSFGYASKSLRGEADRLGKVETVLRKYLSTYYYHADHPYYPDIKLTLSTGELSLLKNYFRFQSQKLDSYFHRSGFEEPVIANFEKQKAGMNRVLELLESDIALRKQTGKSLQNAPQNVLDQLKAQSKERSTLQNWISSVQARVQSKMNFISLSGIRLPKIPPGSEKDTEYLLAELAYALPSKDAHAFVNANWRFSSQEASDRFWKMVDQGRTQFSKTLFGEYLKK